jgi:DNA-binding NarL/FixJ family response regulator
MSGKLKIIIVDDHPLFREGIKLLIEKENIGKVIGEAENGVEFLNILKKSKPDLVLMDIDMPVMDGYEASKLAKAKYPNLKIIVISMFSDKDNYENMISAGVSGFVLKTSGKHEMEKAISNVAKGESYFSAELLREIIINFNRINEEEAKIKEERIEITEREYEVLRCFCEGLTSSEIAAKLFVSVKTIEAHRSKLIHKTNTKNTINLILFAIKNKYVEI